MLPGVQKAFTIILLLDVVGCRLTINNGQTQSLSQICHILLVFQIFLFAIEDVIHEPGIQME